MMIIHPDPQTERALQELIKSGFGDTAEQVVGRLAIQALEGEALGGYQGSPGVPNPSDSVTPG
jgi:hypothetical protein